MADQLSRRDVALILQRTAELERRQVGAGEMITTDDLHKIAEELGMSRQALEQALAENKAGLLSPEEAQSLLDRFYGKKRLEARRFVPGTAVGNRQLIDRYFREQRFDILRRGEDWATWGRTRGVGSWIRRASASGHKLPASFDYRVRITEVPGGPHPVLVQIEVDLTRVRKARTRNALIALGAGVATVIGGAVAAPMPVELVPIAVGTLVGTGGSLWSRASYRETAGQVEAAIGRLLDFLEHEPERMVRERGKDLVSRLMDFMSG